jgi:predicted NBD/HSP70 family sugar kinase
MSSDILLIGIDGGATKVSGWIVEYNHADRTFELAEQHAGMRYADVPGYIPDFKPLSLEIQLNAFSQAEIRPTEAEIRQGRTYTRACAEVIVDLARQFSGRPLLIGIGMPGLKTADRRGIAVVANGPRIPTYALEVERVLSKAGLKLLSPIAHIGSDADYCGLGELHAHQGSFRNISNAYYLGGGTGAADALLLDNILVPFDQIKSWMAKTWELKNDLGRSMERYASASGLQFIYGERAGVSTESLNAAGIFPPQIAEKALEGDKHAAAAFNEAAENLALLFYERITTLYAGYQDQFTFVNPARAALDKTHPYLKRSFDRIVVGQRLGDLMHSRTGQVVLTRPLVEALQKMIDTSAVIPEQIKEHYLHGLELRPGRLFFSPLREAPALGAGIDAYFSFHKSDT